MHRSRLLATTAVLLLLANTTIALAQELSAAQNEVWQMEELYWSDLESANLEAYVGLWHKGFLGWPRDRDLPVGKAGIEQSTRKKFAEGRVVHHEILSKGVTVLGNVGVTQYGVRVLRVEASGDSVTYVSRVTHTWLRIGKTWQIIGGMSAPIESSAHTW